MPRAEPWPWVAGVSALLPQPPAARPPVATSAGPPPREQPGRTRPRGGSDESGNGAVEASASQSPGTALPPAGVSVLPYNLDALWERPYVVERSKLLAALRPHRERLRAMLDQGVTRLQLYRRFTTEVRWPTPISERQFRHILSIVTASPVDPVPRRGPRVASAKRITRSPQLITSASASPSVVSPPIECSARVPGEPASVTSSRVLSGSLSTLPPSATLTPTLLPSFANIGATAQATTASIEESLHEAEAARRREILATG